MKKLLLVSLFLISSTAMAGRLCAVVYTGDYLTGDRLELFRGDSVRNLDRTKRYSRRSFDNAITSIEVARGCALRVWQYSNFGRHLDDGRSIGWNEKIRSNSGKSVQINQLHRYMDNSISSLRCRCRRR